LSGFDERFGDFLVVGSIAALILWNTELDTPTPEKKAMPFESSDAYWVFAESVKHDRRFVYERRVDQFLAAIAETSSTRMKPLKAGSILWRAQLGSRWDIRDKGTPEEMEVEIPYFEDRMKPLPSLVTDGRANPRGIAYLYLADSETTAGSELRPWLGASISMSQFRVHRDLQIADCTSDKKRWPFKGFNADMTGTVPWGPEEYEGVVWGDIAHAMSTPYSPEQVSLNYVPTQVISERLRHAGADGIAYKSLLAPGGTNFVLFDIRDADPINFILFEAEKVSYHFSQLDNPYFSKKYLNSKSDASAATPNPQPSTTPEEPAE
jgi:hypothetical protein